MIIVQYYIVLCAKFHLKNHLQKEEQHGACWGFQVYSKSFKKYKGTKPTAWDAWASFHSTGTCLCDFHPLHWYEALIHCAPPNRSPKQRFNFTARSYTINVLFGASANSFPNGVSLTQWKSHYTRLGFCPKLFDAVSFFFLLPAGDSGGPVRLSSLSYWMLVVLIYVEREIKKVLLLHIFSPCEVLKIAYKSK